MFIVRLNDKSAAGMVSQVSFLIKSTLGEDNVVILHNNDTRI
jgi:hypothetical protein